MAIWKAKEQSNDSISMKKCCCLSKWLGTELNLRKRLIPYEALLMLFQTVFKSIDSCPKAAEEVWKPRKKCKDKKDMKREVSKWTNNNQSENEMAMAIKESAEKNVRIVKPDSCLTSFCVCLVYCFRRVCHAFVYECLLILLLHSKCCWSKQRAQTTREITQQFVIGPT